MLRLTLVCSFILWLLALPLFAQWQFTPAGGEGIENLAADRTAHRLILSSACGLQRSTDGGQSWQPLAHPYAGDAPWFARCTAVDPNGDTLFAARGRDGSGTPLPPAISQDGGLNWFVPQDPLAETIRTLQPWRVQRDVWLAITDEQSLLMSTNRGADWRLQSADGPPEYALYQDPLADSTLYSWSRLNEMRGGAGPILRRSTDLGQSWEPLYPFAFNHWSTDYAGVLRAQDGALLVMLWDTQSFSLRHVLAQSYDNGETWSLRYEFPEPFYASELWADVTQPGVFYCTDRSAGRILRSIDDGLSWQELPPLHPGGHVESLLAQHPETGALYAQAGSLGLYRTMPPADFWDPVPTPPCGTPGALGVFSQAVVLHSERDRHRLLWEHDALTNRWSIILPPAGFQPRVCALEGDDIAVLVLTEDLNFCRMAWSTDYGAQWETGDPVSTRPYLISTDPRLVLVPTRNHAPTNQVLTSLDQGRTWRVTQPVPEGQQVLQVVQSAAAIYIATGPSPGQVYRSTDDGASWRPLDWPRGQRYYPQLCNVEDELFVLAPRTPVQHWQNGVWDERGVCPGVGSWRMPSFVAVPGAPATLVALDEDSSDWWVSTDGGYTWLEHRFAFPDLGQPPMPRGLTFDRYRNRLWVNTVLGPCYLEADEALDTGDSDFILQPSSFRLSTFPNPFNSVTRIQYVLPQAGEVELKLYDLEGRLVKTLADVVQPAGSHELKLVADELSSGTYFLRLRTPAGARTHKLLLLK